MHCSLTRSVTLHARHRYGPATASGPSGDHGHLYRIDVSVSANDARRACVIDLELFDAVLEREIVRPLDGRHLNEAVAEFASGVRPPTCEALAAWCWQQVARRLPSDVRLDRIRVAEDDTLWADCSAAE